MARASELDRVLERAALEDFTVANDGRSISDVAHELLERAGWIDANRG